MTGWSAILRGGMLAWLAVSASACERPEGDTRTAAPDSAASVAARPPVAALQGRFPGLTLRWHAGQPVPGTGYHAAVMRYETPGDESGYGAVVAVWADDGRLVWTLRHPGDFPPHTLHWLDADRDGRVDLFFTAGEETVFETYLFVGRTADSASVDPAYALAYRSLNDYTTLLDLDGDGAPELIDSGHAGNEHADGAACEGAAPPAEVTASARAEYDRRVGRFDAANFKYGFDDFAPFTLHLLDPVRILQVRGGEVRDASRSFPDHLGWRLATLRQYRAAADADCAIHIDEIIRHLRSLGA